MGDILCAPFFLVLFLGGEELDFDLLKEAQKRVPCIPVLINMCSKRVKQLNSGFRPYVKTSGSPSEEKIDIALKEIAEGKLTAEIDFVGPDKETDDDSGTGAI